MAATTVRLRPCLTGQLSIFLHTRAQYMRQIIARHPSDTYHLWGYNHEFTH